MQNFCLTVFALSFYNVSFLLSSDFFKFNFLIFARLQLVSEKIFVAEIKAIVSDGVTNQL